MVGFQGSAFKSVGRFLVGAEQWSPIRVAESFPLDFFTMLWKSSPQVSVPSLCPPKNMDTFGAFFDLIQFSQRGPGQL
jgi:hypothetical protein